MARRQYTDEQLDRAVALVQDGMSQRAAAREAGISLATLQRRLNGSTQVTRPKSESTRKGDPPRSRPEKTPSPGRDEKGRFLPGVSGNPGGKPTHTREARRIAEEYTPEAMRRLIAMAEDPEITPRVRLGALQELLDRGLGRAKQSVAMDIDLTETHQYHITQEILTRSPDLLDTIFSAPPPRQEVLSR